MSAIGDFAISVPGFYRLTAVDQLLALAWFVEVEQKRSFFDGAYMQQCFREAGEEPPDMSMYLPRLAAKKPPQLMKEKGGYRLAGAVRRTLDARLGRSPTVVAVEKALIELPAKLPDLAEREFLSEALNCYRVQAYRAAIIMAWNLAYDHVLRWTFADPCRLATMNGGITTKYPGKKLTLVKIEDASELKEFEFIEAARTAKILDKNVTQILKEKLGRRNLAAHPSRVYIGQHSADEMIVDLVTNVILKLT